MESEFSKVMYQLQVIRVSGTPTFLKRVSETTLTTDTIGARLRTEARKSNPKVIREYFPSDKKGTMLVRYKWNTDYGRAK